MSLAELTSFIKDLYGKWKDDPRRELNNVLITEFLRTKSCDTADKFKLFGEYYYDKLEELYNYVNFRERRPRRYRQFADMYSIIFDIFHNNKYTEYGMDDFDAVKGLINMIEVYIAMKLQMTMYTDLPVKETRTCLMKSGDLRIFRRITLTDEQTQFKRMLEKYCPLSFCTDDIIERTKYSCPPARSTTTTDLDRFVKK